MIRDVRVRDVRSGIKTTNSSLLFRLHTIYSNPSDAPPPISTAIAILRIVNCFICSNEKPS
jgi:hypothetical protein